LDEQIKYVSSDGNTVRVRQYILGHHNSPFLRFAIRNPAGWQPKEMIREYYRIRMQFSGGDEIVTREIDLRSSFG